MSDQGDYDNQQQQQQQDYDDNDDHQQQQDNNIPNDSDNYDNNQQQQDNGDYQQQNDNQDNNDQQNNDYDNNQDNNQSQDVQDSMYKPQETHYDGDPESNIYHRHNKMIFSNFVHEYNKELIDYFTDFSKEEEGAEPQIKGQDFPLVIRVAFYIDNITFHSSKEDEEEFFSKEDSYKAVIAQLEKFSQITGIYDSDQVDVSQEKFNFQNFIDYCEYFIQNEPSIFLRRVDNEAPDDASQLDQDHQTGLEKEIKENIQKYENMLQEATTENERIVINNMLKALFDQLAKIEQLKQPLLNQQPKKRMTKEEIRKKNLNEIFLFYCKQQYTQAPKYSFDRILYESHTMNMSNFLLFAKQFKVTNYCLKLTKKQLPQLFKKTSNNYKDLTFQEFQILLEKIAILMFEEKEDLPSEFDKIEAFYKYIGVDDQNFFRQHMHLLNPPFNIQDKVGFRHLPKDAERKIEIRKIPQKLKNELDKRKKERDVLVHKYVSMTPAAAPSQKQFYGKSASQPPLPNSGLQHSQSQKNPFSYQYDNYAARNHQKQVSKLNLNNKVSWQQLEKISYADMKQLNKNNNKFKPTDLFQEADDNEDKIYLKQYNLEEEKNKKQELSYIHRKEQEKYGSNKGNLRPTQKYLLKHDPNYSERGYQNSNVHRSHQYEEQNSGYYQNSPQNYQQQQQYGGGNKNLTKNQSYIGQNYMARAQQVDNYQRERENQQMQYAMQYNDQKVQRGMYAAKR